MSVRGSDSVSIFDSGKDSLGSGMGVDFGLGEAEISGAIGSVMGEESSFD